MPAVLDFDPQTIAADLDWLTPAEQAELDTLIGDDYAAAQCAADRAYFIDSFCQLKAKPDDAEDTAPSTGAQWVPFHLWPAQRAIVAAVDSGDHLIIMKARQLGQTALILACILWQVLFRPACTALLFSKRETEAWALLTRLKQMYTHLPPFLRAKAGGVLVDASAVWRLGNGSEVLAFPTTAGDSYTAQIALCDEFDLVEGQDTLLQAVGPTVIESGQLILLSRVDKARPLTAFKRLYQQAKTGLAGWRAIFLPWRARPGRDDAWYAARVAESVAQDGTLDGVQEQYPATDGEALAPKSLNKRIPSAWLLPCYVEGVPQFAPGAPALPGLTIYAPPAYGTAYVIGADPAEGNPTSDPSSATVIDALTGREVAHLAGQFEPTEFAGYLAQLAAYYALNRGRARPDGPAGVLVERNNHGHAVLAGLRAAGHLPLHGLDGRPGWLSSPAGKVRLYDVAAQSLRAGDAGIATFQTYVQLASIESATLRAPEGQHDDDADGWALAQAARTVQTVPLSTAAPSVRRALAGFRG